MKKARRLFTLFLSLILFCSAFSLTSFAAKDDDDEDYAVSDVGFDVSDDSIYIYWETGESKCSYKVELFKSSNMVAKNRVGEIMTASYSAARIDVTQRIINKGSGTYYARVTCKKKPKGESEYEYAVGHETISSDELSEIKKNYKAEKKAAEEQAKQNPTTGVSGTGGGPGVSAGGSANPSAGNGGAQWQSLGGGSWAAVNADGTRLTGWYQMDGKWYYSGEDGVMWANKWIASATEQGVWFYVGSDGAMVVSNVTPDGYQTDAEGKWRE
ncbi:MAG: hypothetical protein IJT43_05895 [Stomatobaculum sp.]|nr:hypothetical protein [Stomatobaculum sp.]